MRLGIDFGTTRTVVSGALGGRYPVMCFDVGGVFRDHLPGAAAVTGDGALVFGWEARALLAERPTEAVRSIKRAITGLAPDEIVPGLERTGVTALELVTGYLAALRRAIVEQGNLDIHPGEPLEVTIAVPANASSQQRYLTLEAFTRAGFEVQALLNEPTAAAIEFAHRNAAGLGPRSPKRYVVVYDLGGGTFDTAAVSLEGRRFTLLASEGLQRLGGDDFDAVILELALAKAGVSDLSLASVERAALLDLCREAKETLKPTSRRLLIDPTAVGAAAILGRDPIVLDVAEIYAQSQPLVDHTLELVDTLFAHLVERGIDPESSRELGGLYLVGGSTAFPAVARALRARHGRKIQLAPEPHASTAVGLAVAGDPAAHVFVREAPTRHLGVWREAAEGRDKVFDLILSKDTAAPPEGGAMVVERSYHPRHTVGHLRFLECAALDPDQQPAGDVTPLDRVVFPYDPALAEAKDLSQREVEANAALEAEEIREVYTYAADGTVTIAIENRTHGYRRSFVLGAAR